MTGLFEKDRAARFTLHLRESQVARARRLHREAGADSLAAVFREAVERGLTEIEGVVKEGRAQ